MRSRKQVLAFILAALMSVSAVGCSSSGKGEASQPSQAASQTDSSKKVTIKLFSRYGDTTAVDSAVFREAVAAFQSQNPNITVVDESISDETQYNNKFKTDMSANDIPTLFMTYGGGTLKSYVDDGIVEDVTPYLEANKDWYDQFDPKMFNAVKFSGKNGIYGIPNAAYADSLYCNMKLFKEAGLSVPATIEDFEKVCDAFVKKGITPMPVGDKSNFRGGHLLGCLMVKRTGNELANNLAARKATYKDATVTELLTLMKSWKEKGYLGTNVTTLDGEGECQLFLTGKSPMIYRNAYFIGRIIKESKDAGDVQEIPFPYFSQYPQYKDGWHGSSSDEFSIAKSATDDQKKAAIALLKSCISTKYINERNQKSAGGFVSVFKETPKMDNESALAATFHKNFSQAKYMLTEPGEYDSNPGVREATRKNIQAMWSGQSVQNTENAIQQIIDTE